MTKRHIILFFLTSFLASFSAIARANHVSEVKWKPNSVHIRHPYDGFWSYWGIGLAGGAGYVTDVAGIGIGRGPGVLPDFRLSLSKSFYLSKGITFEVDLSAKTPAIHVGALLGKRCRVSLGAALWTQTFMDPKADLPTKTMRNGVPNRSLAREEVHAVWKPAIPVIPYLSFDVAPFKHSFIRLSLSYSQIARQEVRYSMPEVKEIPNTRRNLKTDHWLQATLGFHFRF